MSAPEQAEIRAEVEAADVLIIGDGGGDAGVGATRVDRSSAPPDWELHATILSKTSPIASELARLGITASTSPALYQMVVPASVQNGLLTGFSCGLSNNSQRRGTEPKDFVWM